MSAPFVVHQSHIKCFLHCRQQEHYRYRELIQRRRRPAPLVRGTIIHKMVELHSFGKDPIRALKAAEKEYAKLFLEEQEEYGDLIGDIRRLMDCYFEWYARDPLTPIQIKKRMAEHKFSVELCKGIVLEGKIDRFVRRRDGLKCLEDTKTHKTLPEGDINYSDIQTMLYVWATPIYFGFTPDMIAWNYIRWKAPTIPELLKSGELSKRKNIDTMWPVFLEAIQRNKLDPSDYTDVKGELAGREATFFKRSYVPVHKAVMNNVVEQSIEIAKEIKSQPKPVRNIGRHCQWCEYYGLCQAEFRGLDAKEVRKRDYERKPEDEVEEIETA